jgi:hypothetical protein
MRYRHAALGGILVGLSLAALAAAFGASLLLLLAVYAFGFGVARWLP